MRPLIKTSSRINDSNPDFKYFISLMKKNDECQLWDFYETKLRQYKSFGFVSGSQWQCVSSIRRCIGVGYQVPGKPYWIDFLKGNKFVSVRLEWRVKLCAV